MVCHVLGVPKPGARALCLSLFLLVGKDGKKVLVIQAKSMPCFEERVEWSWRSVSCVTSDYGP